LETDLDKARRVIEVRGNSPLCWATRDRQPVQRERADIMIDEAIAELQPLIGVRAACRATGRARAAHYRRHRQSPVPPRPLSPLERDRVRAVLDSEGFADKAPATVYHELLDAGVCLASVSRMYRTPSTLRSLDNPIRRPGPSTIRYVMNDHLGSRRCGLGRVIDEAAIRHI
jgi:hypothetical protein